MGAITERHANRPLEPTLCTRCSDRCSQLLASNLLATVQPLERSSTAPAGCPRLPRALLSAPRPCPCPKSGPAVSRSRSSAFTRPHSSCYALIKHHLLSTQWVAMGRHSYGHASTSTGLTQPAGWRAQARQRDSTTSCTGRVASSAATAALTAGPLPATSHIVYLGLCHKPVEVDEVADGAHQMDLSSSTLSKTTGQKKSLLHRRSSTPGQVGRMDS